MKTVCVIGNSHAGALRLGFQAIEDKRFNVSFFSLAGGGGPAIAAKEGRILVPEPQMKNLHTDIPSAEAGRLDLAGYDAILLSGVGMPAIRRQYEFSFPNKYGVAGFLDPQSACDRQVVSRKVFSALLESTMSQLNSVRNLSLVRSVFSGKIFFQMMPLPVERIQAQRDFSLRCYGQDLGRFLL